MSKQASPQSFIPSDIPSLFSGERLSAHVQHILVCLMILCRACIFADTQEITSKAPPPHLAIQKPPRASEESWEAVQPYLLPCTHPAKPALDKIFSQGRPLLSPQEMKRAGFFKYTPSDKDIIVSGHPRLKGYLIKAYLDTCWLPEWKLWIQRIVGARQIAQSIAQLGYSSIMKAPKKWIYALPPSAPLPEGEGYYPKSYVLVVQDMGLYSEIANCQSWKHYMDAYLLEAFYHMVMVNGLIDSYYIDNSPFCFDRKIAFVDTEHYNVDLYQFPGRQEVLLQFLSKPMRQHWECLIRNGGAG